jgi:hypothetical protein
MSVLGSRSASIFSLHVSVEILLFFFVGKLVGRCSSDTSSYRFSTDMSARGRAHWTIILGAKPNS